MGSNPEPSADLRVNFYTIEMLAGECSKVKYMYTLRRQTTERLNLYDQPPPELWMVFWKRISTCDRFTEVERFQCSWSDLPTEAVSSRTPGPIPRDSYSRSHKSNIGNVFLTSSFEHSTARITALILLQTRFDLSQKYVFLRWQCQWGSLVKREMCHIFFWNV